jgi:hypothetical protein
MATFAPDASQTPPAVDPDRVRYPGSRDRDWARRTRGRWLSRWTTVAAGERHGFWFKIKQRMQRVFNPRWLP